MEFFYSGGGNNRPDFTYLFKIKRLTTEMYEWCKAYPEKGPFSRWHYIPNTGNVHRDSIIQFELRDAYLVFQWAFAGEILEDLTWNDFR